MQQVTITYKLNDSNRTIILKSPNTKGKVNMENKENIRQAIINTFPLQFISEFFMQRYSNDIKIYNEFMLGIQKEYCPLYLQDVRIEFSTDEPFELRTSNKKVAQGQTTLDTIMNVVSTIKEHFNNVSNDKHTTVEGGASIQDNSRSIEKPSTKGTKTRK